MVDNLNKRLADLMPEELAEPGPVTEEQAEAFMKGRTKIQLARSALNANNKAARRDREIRLLKYQLTMLKGENDQLNRCLTEADGALDQAVLERDVARRTSDHAFRALEQTNAEVGRLNVENILQRSKKEILFENQQQEGKTHEQHKRNDMPKLRKPATFSSIRYGEA